MRSCGAGFVVHVMLEAILGGLLGKFYYLNGVNLPGSSVFGHVGLHILHSMIDFFEFEEPFVAYGFALLRYSKPLCWLVF
jgi:hypothetical protein